MAEIRLKFSTIDRFSERKTFKSFKGASAYARRRIGSPYDISETFGYAIDMHGIGKLEIVGGDMGVTLAKLLETEPTPEACRWFALCTNPATGTTPHPVLGDVPTCDRCHAFATEAP